MRSFAIQNAYLFGGVYHGAAPYELGGSATGDLITDKSHYGAVMIVNSLG
jgi:hypothetical protein